MARWSLDLGDPFFFSGSNSEMSSNTFDPGWKSTKDFFVYNFIVIASLYVLYKSNIIFLSISSVSVEYVTVVFFYS